ncbi:MAG: hypothetical protein ACRC6I_09250 [Paracoccaceae bacterium]
MARKALIALITAYAIPAFAEDRVAIVVSSDAGSAPTESMRKDAFALSETLFGMGFAVTRMENPQAADLTAALSRVPKDATALLFFSGVARPEGPETMLVTGAAPVPLSGALTALQGTGRTNSLVFLDTCRAGAEVLPPPAAPAGVFLALPVAPGATCVEGAPTMAQEMLARITAPGVAVTEQFAGDATGPWVQSTLTAPFVFRAASSETVLTAADYRMLESLSAEDRDKMIALWAEAGIAVDVAGARPVAAAPGGAAGTVSASPVIVMDAGIISPVQAVASPIVAGAVVEGEALAVLAAAPATPRSTGARPVPGAGGLPQPSIILGETETLASLAVPEEAVAPVTQQLDYTDMDARNAAKEADAAAYVELIAAGAYDPPPEQLAFAVQTELARMNCYTRAIDGDWGNGSRRALQLYFDTLKVAATTQEPTVEVFRQLLTEDAVACPDVVAPAPAAATPRTTQRTTTRQTAPAPQAAAPAPAPAPAPAETGRRIRTGTGTGAFR